ncbi:short-chain collagen C4-like isoform X1 [Acanthaster planci]|uniref:Short-chain collagen C4-like isoform X1 n=1 Tax=Acanthaster planci TaxID=133434 RepID=A0A8B7ZYE2_ACAPL|nr:short-chain collagen C4-like isoform X1 [Acanthaster planci]XP_022110554.1 short-chain collagen C4-like isoform X1 [Acanthaster planci]XP_022110555.1 short-chain collagen C4-like isoform X1 [Acanthaster planci]
MALKSPTMIAGSRFLTRKSTPARNEKFGRWILAGVLLNLCLGISVSGRVVLQEDRWMSSEEPLSETADDVRIPESSKSGNVENQETEVAVAYGILRDTALSSEPDAAGEEHQEVTALARRSSGGDTYVRWGRTTCPRHSGTRLVYAGYATSSHYSHKGGTSDFICLPKNPQWASHKDGFNSHSFLYGTEYQVGNFDPFSHKNAEHLNNHAVPCAVCRLVRKTKLLYPARLSCPTGWRVEYSGFLMAGHYTHGRTEALCVDKEPEAVVGSSAAKYEALLYVMESVCGSLHCPPYVNGREITCTVCSI